VNDDKLTGSLERTAGENVGTYAISQGTLANSNYNINFIQGQFTIVSNGDHVADTEISQVTVIQGTLLFNDGKGSVKGDFYTMGYSELVSMELKRTSAKINTNTGLAAPSLNRINVSDVYDKPMSLNNIMVKVSSHIAAVTSGPDGFAGGEEIFVDNSERTGSISFRETVKLPSSFADSGKAALAAEYDIPVVDSFEMPKLPEFKTEIEKIIDEMLIPG
jgi:hypothetical protein